MDIIEIYGIYNLVNGKMYIGQTKQGYRKRFTQHKSPTDGSPLLRKAIAKYGRDNFTCELLDVAYNREDANAKEMAWIGALKTYKKENGYNLSMGGAFGNFNEDTLAKMSESHKGKNNHFYGKHHSEESRRRMSEAKKTMYTKGNHPRAKKVICVETGKVYDCIKSAELDTGACSRHIGQVANNKYGRKTAGGYKWIWA